jgi:hypothetical protein
MESNVSLTEYENRREDRLRKFIDYLDPNVDIKLSESDLYYYELMHKSFHWLHTFFSPSDVHKRIIAEGRFDGKPYSSSMAYQVLADAAHLFGKIGTIDKEAMAKVIIEHYFKSTQMAMADKKASGLEKAEMIAKNADRVAKLFGLFSKDMDIDPQKLMGNMTLVFKNQGDVELSGQKNIQLNE